MTIFAPAISKSEHWLAVELLSFLHSKPAPVAKLVDALDLGSSNASCVGSSPIRRTDEYLVEFQQDTHFFNLQLIIMTVSPILEKNTGMTTFCKTR